MSSKPWKQAERKGAAVIGTTRTPLSGGASHLERICQIDYKGELVPATIRAGKHSFYRTKDYKAARECLTWHYKAAYNGECKNDRLYRVDAQIYEPGGETRRKWRRADIDNYVKPLLDAATGIIWKDDNQIIELHLKLIRDAPMLHTKVIIYDIGYWHHYYVKIKCQNCDKEFEVTLSEAKRINRRFCSNACRYACGTTIFTCLNCSTEFSSTKSRRKGKPFCSRQCAFKYRRKHSKASGQARLLLNS